MTASTPPATDRHAARRSAKVVAFADLIPIVERRGAQDGAVAVCFGVFDPLTVEHVHTLADLAGRHDGLAVALVGGGTTPDAARVARLAVLKSVDWVADTGAAPTAWRTLADRLPAGATAFGIGLEAAPSALPTAAPSALPTAAPSALPTAAPPALPTVAESPPCPPEDGHRAGLAAAARGDLGAAVMLLRTAARMAPGDARLLNDLARIAFDARDCAIAGAAARCALMSEPANESLQHLAGLALLADGSPEDALPFLERALRIKPEVATFHIDRAMALRDAERFDEAVATAKEALRIAPDDRGVHHTLGLCLRSRGDFQEAATRFSMSIRLDPDAESFQQFMDALFLDAAARDAGGAEGLRDPAGPRPRRNNDMRVVRRTVGGALEICCFDLVTRSPGPAGEAGPPIAGSVLAGNLDAAAAGLRDEPGWCGAVPVLEAFAAALRGDAAAAAGGLAAWLQGDGCCRVRLFGPAPIAAGEATGQDISHVEIAVPAGPVTVPDRIAFLVQLLERFAPAARNGSTEPDVASVLCEAAALALAGYGDA